MTEARQQHWDGVYTTRQETEVSWFQDTPSQSLHLIRTHVADRTAPIIDVGGGASRLVDALAAAGFAELTVLDVSAAALATAKARLGAAAAKVAWLVADVTQWQPHRQWRVWHDRGVFHFLTLPGDQDTYLAALHRGTASGAIVVMATFALDGPERCSGLPVQRYSPATLQARLGAEFDLVEQAPERHVTPRGAIQSFTYAVFVRT